MSKTIRFLNSVGEIEAEYSVKPASKFLPEWYKKTPSFRIDFPGKTDGNGQSGATIKKCVPVFDSMTSGYIIPTPCDVVVSQKNGTPWFEWSFYQRNLVTFHDIQQAEYHPQRMENSNFPKWISPWIIQTPKGYSCLFVPPLHRESVFTILPGIVDTDRYLGLAVNFPFSLKDPKWEGVIPAGTPIVQVMPFKRESWNHKIEPFSSSVETLEKEFNVKLRSNFFQSYKRKFWTRKEFK